MKSDRETKAAMFLAALASLGGSFTPVASEKSVITTKTGRRDIDRPTSRTMSASSSANYVEDSHGSIRRINPKLSKKERRLARIKTQTTFSKT